MPADAGRYSKVNVPCPQYIIFPLSMVRHLHNKDLRRKGYSELPPTRRLRVKEIVQTDLGMDKVRVFIALDARDRD